MKKRTILIIFFLIGLFYILAPGPTKISDFPAIPNSVKSDEPGDTYQVQNIAAYFSDYDRSQITNHYKNAYRDRHFFGILLPSIRLNHPPEFARKVVRDEQVSTFLEEYVYPLRGSIFVNGYEPFVENEMKERSHNFVGDHIHINGRYFISKTTLRFYPADSFARLIVYLGIWISLLAIYDLQKRVFSKEKGVL